MSSGSRAASIPLVAGRPCLDLANTVSWRSVPERREEHLRRPDDVLTWSTRAGLLEPAEAELLAELVDQDPRCAQTLVDDLLEVRRSIWTHVVDPVRINTEALSPLAARTLTACTLHNRDGRAEWRVATLDEHTPAHRAVLDLLDLLTHPTGRIGHCLDPTCRWAFVDTSRAKNRRWCSSADCGNRHRVRQHHARQQGAPPS